jgi:hypothetical protein
MRFLIVSWNLLQDVFSGIISSSTTLPLPPLTKRPYSLGLFQSLCDQIQNILFAHPKAKTWKGRGSQTDQNPFIVYFKTKKFFIAVCMRFFLLLRDSLSACCVHRENELRGCTCPVTFPPQQGWVLSLTTHNLPCMVFNFFCTGVHSHCWNALFSVRFFDVTY